MFLPKWPNFQKFQLDINKTPKIDQPNIAGMKLENMLELSSRFANPHKKMNNIIHVAGTNGKGSFIAFLKAMLESKDYSVNIYTSPHLINFNERIYIKGKFISDYYLNELSDYCAEICNRDPKLEPSFFEGVTLLALLAFAENQADFNIIETGMGGRLDATNIFTDKLATILMPIGLDHQEFLGNNLLDIAGEKAGIILPNSKVYIAKQDKKVNEFLIKYIAERQSKGCFFAQDFNFQAGKYSDNNLDLAIDHIPLLGEHQKENLAIALKVFLDITNYQDSNISLNKVSWPGRIQKLHHLISKYSQHNVWLDGGHNEHAADALAKWLKTQSIDYIIIAMNNNKDLANFSKKLSISNAKLIFTEMTKYQHAYQISDLNLQDNQFTAKYSDIINALDDINKNNPAANILICGSLYLVAEVLERVNNKIIY